MCDADSIRPKSNSNVAKPTDSIVSKYVSDPLSPQPEEVDRLVADLTARLADSDRRIEELQEAQRKLEDYRDRYIDLYDFAPLGYASLDADGYIQEINLAGAQLLGLDRNALTGYAFGDYVAEEDRKTFLEHLATCVRELREVTCELRLVAPERLPIVVQLRSIPIQGPHEEKLCKTAITDITARKDVEEALRRSQTFLQTVIDAIPDTMLVIGRDYRILLANRAARQMAGGIDPTLCLTCHQLSHHRELPCEGRNEPCPLHQVIATKAPVTVRHTHYDAAGNEIFVEISAAPVFDEAGEVVHVIEACRDISDRERAEEKLRDNEARHRAILEASLDAIVTIDERGIIESVNPAMQRLFGYTAAEMLGSNVSMLMPSPHREMHDGYIANYLRTGRAKIIGIGREVSGQRKDGTLFPMDLSISEVRFNGQRRFMGLVHDLTERKRAEDALRKARDELEIRVRERTAELIAANEKLTHERRLFNTLMDYLPHSIYFKDAASRFTRINKALSDSFGLTDAAEAIGKTDRDFFTAEHALQAMADEQDILGTGQPIVDKEEKETWPDGHETWVSTTKMPLYDEMGRVVGTFGISRDITERKEAEEAMRAAKEAAEAANRAKSTFLANMSHEIRTPMNAIIGMTELVLDTPLSRQQREFLTIVGESAESLLALINDILDFSKIEAGKFALDCAPFDVREQLGDTMKTLALRADRKGIELACHIHPHVPEVVVGDSARLRQVLINLVGNAIKFTDVGEVVVEVEHEPMADNDVLLHFKVADTGIGIPPEKQAAVFEAFEQGDGTISRRYGGTGLGLAISSRLVNLLGGRMWVESQIGRGSTFHFDMRCPLGVAEPSPATCPQPQAIRGTRVLAVDDNATNRLILEEMLGNWMLRPTSVAGGQDALQLLRQARQEDRPFGLVLTDAHMPGMDGFSLVRAIKEDPCLGSTVIMMLTSEDQPADVARCQELGVSTYLVKPVKQSELFDAIMLAMGIATAEDDVGRSPAERRFGRVRPLQVLLAEDSLVNQKLVVTLLERDGHAVTVVGNGREALATLESQKFDLVLMDVQMPEMDGLEATAAIRVQERQSGGHVPIIAMTAHALKGDRERCLESGMDEYIAKPIHARQLWETIERVLEGAATPETPWEVPSSEASVVEWSEVLKAAKGDRTVAATIIEAALEECPRLLAGIRDAVASRDRTALRLAAHTLRGSVQYFGAARVRELAHQLERMGQEGDLASAEAALADLETEMTCFTGMLEEHRAK